MLTGLFLFALATDGAMNGQSSTQDYQSVDLGDGYVRVVTSTYSIEVPQNWKISPETSFGQRKIAEPSGGNLGVMTAPPTDQSWESLYRTALYFVTRERPGQPTPYTIEKHKTGLESCVFSVKNESGFADRRFVMIKSPAQGLLALSVEIPNETETRDWERHFRRMVESAKFLPG
ncbi:MAG: hypothetical protein KF812_10775 [Fimbriimonadaceae bacterium]|nr:hypothetical protein [Fimbriimonadaceae bacterium]